METEAPVTYIHVILQPSAVLEYAIPEEHNAIVHVLRGSGRSNDGEGSNADKAKELLRPHEAVVLERAGTGMRVESTGINPLEFILISGQPLNEIVVQYGPFAMSSKTEIFHTIIDFQSAKFGFEIAHRWESEIARL